jgi:iron complex transport system permease protein
MAPFTYRKLLLTLGLAVGGWAVIAAACMMVGSRSFGWPADLVFGFRREAVLTASLIGAALAAAGCAYQAVLRNPLADPYLLGVSSGANLFAYLWKLPVITSVFGFLGTMSQPAFSFIGALIAVGVVFSLASRRGRLEPITLLLVGVIVNAICSSIYLLVNELNKGLSGMGSEMSFLVGGLQPSLSAEQVRAAAVVIGLATASLLFIAGKLNVASLSDDEAASLGVHIHALRWTALLAASLMTASAVAISGPIGFVGLVAPHLGRLLVGVDMRRLFPLSTALGASLLCLADAATRGLARPDFAGSILPVGVLTGLLGGPFFLLLLWQHRRKG